MLPKRKRWMGKRGTGGAKHQAPDTKGLSPRPLSHAQQARGDAKTEPTARNSSKFNFSLMTCRASRVQQRHDNVVPTLAIRWHRRGMCFYQPRSSIRTIRPILQMGGVVQVERRDAARTGAYKVKVVNYGVHISHPALGMACVSQVPG